MDEERQKTNEYIDLFQKEMSGIHILILIEVAAAIFAGYMFAPETGWDIFVVLLMFAKAVVALIFAYFILVVCLSYWLKTWRKMTPMRFNRIVCLMPIIVLIIYSVSRIIHNG